MGFLTFHLDELIFSFTEIGGYQAAIKFNDRECRLILEIFSLKGLSDEALKRIESMLSGLTALKPYYEKNNLEILFQIKKELPLPEILKKQEISLL